MSDESPYDRPESTRPIPWSRPRESPGPGLAIAIVVAVVAILAVGFWLRRQRQPPPPEIAAAVPTAPAAPAAAEPAAPAFALPALDASDAAVRQLAATLSAHPRFAAWLVHEDLVRRAVAAVIRLADGESPGSQLGFLRPEEPFRARRSGGRWFVDPEGFRRYDLLAEVVASIDAAAAARLLRELHPLLDQAYGEIGDPRSSFGAALGRAVGNLLAVAIPEDPPELVRQPSSFHFAERKLEARSAAEKHLLRMGPANARRVQAKLREIADAANLALR